MEVRADGIYVALAARATAGPHRLRCDGRDDVRVGRDPRVRDGRPLEPRIRRRDARGRGNAATSRSSASVTRARPRSPRPPTASSPDKLAACFAIAGPGSTNLLTGLYDAKVDRAPVLAISGQVPSKVRGRGAFQDLDLTAAFSDVAVYSQTVQRDSDHGELMSLACKHALVQRGVAHLVLPDEVQVLPAGDAAKVGTPSGRLADTGDRAARGTRRTGGRAARRARKRPVVIVGHGARAGIEARRLARRAAARADRNDVQSQGHRARRPPARVRRARPQRHTGRVVAR